MHQNINRRAEGWDGKSVQKLSSENLGKQNAQLYKDYFDKSKGAWTSSKAKAQFKDNIRFIAGEKKAIADKKHVLTPKTKGETGKTKTAETNSERKNRLNKNREVYEELAFPTKEVLTKETTKEKRAREKKAQEIKFDTIEAFREKIVGVSNKFFKTATYEEYGTEIADATNKYNAKEARAFEIAEGPLLQHFDAFNRKFRETGKGVENTDFEGYMNSYIVQKVGTGTAKVKKQVFGEDITGIKESRLPTSKQPRVELDSKEQEHLGIDLSNRLFETGKVNKSGEPIIDNKKRNEVLNDIDAAIDNLLGKKVDKEGNIYYKTPEKLADLDLVEVKNFIDIVYRGKGHAIYSALSKATSDKIHGKTTKEKLKNLGERWDLFDNSMGYSVVKYSGTKSDLAVGKEGRSARVSPGLLQIEVTKRGAKNSVVKPLFYEPAKRVGAEFDPTGAAVTEQTKIEGLTKSQWLAKLAIKEVRKEVPKKEGDGFDIVSEYVFDKTLLEHLVKGVPEAKTVDQLLRNIKDTKIPTLLNDVPNKNLVGQQLKKWTTENYNDNPSLMEAISEAQLKHNLSMGKPSKLQSDNLDATLKDRGIKLPDNKVMEALGLLYRDPKKLRTENEDLFKALIDFVKVESTIKSEIGEKDAIDFSKAAKTLEHEFLKEGTWQISVDKFKKDMGLLKEFMKHSHDLALQIPIYKNKQNGNARLIQDLFTGQFSVMRGITEYDKVDSPFKKGIRENLHKDSTSILDKKILERWEKFPFEKLVTSYASPFKTGLKKIYGANSLPEQRKIAKEVFKGEQGELMMELYDLWNTTLESWLHKEIKKEVKNGKIIETIVETKVGSKKWNEKANFITRLKKHNSSIGTTGERILAPVGYVFLPGKSYAFGRLPKDASVEQIRDWKRTLKKEPDYEVFYKRYRKKGLTSKEAESKALEDLNVKFEHLKSSSEQSFESLDLILNNQWSKKGKEALKTYEGVWGILGQFKVLDAATGQTNVSKIHRFAKTLELAKHIYSVKSGFKRTLYEDIVKDVGKKEIALIEKQIKQLKDLEIKNIKNAPKIVKDGLSVAKLNSENLNKNFKTFDKALAEGRKGKKKKQGMSTFDFDETVGVSENYIFATKGKETKKIASHEWPVVGEQLRNEGWKMDFTDFNKVTKGKPGPLMQKLKNQIKKFGNENVFILTARDHKSAKAIHEYLKSEGVELPLKNITGLGNSTGEAKAMWMLEKFGEGYNDMYFVDDAISNVKAVKDVLSQLDIKSKVQQARKLNSENIDVNVNDIMEHTFGIESKKRFSKAEGKMRGSDKKRRKFFIPDSAADLELLIEPLLGKGKKGIKNRKWFNENFHKPFERGINDLNNARQTILNDYMSLRKLNKDVVKSLDKPVEGTNFTADQAARVYIWNKAGFEAPGLTKTSKAKLLEHVANNPKLQAYAESVAKLTKIETGLKKPSEHWWAETLAAEVSETGRTIGRDKYIGDWIEAKNEIFSEENLAKMESELGPRWREAMDGMLYRMESGRMRAENLDRLSNEVMDYLNGATGAIMHLNTRSAALQLISTVNFINHGENNPFAAAKAFANQPQYWKDFMHIMNSPMLKQRRDGLQINVSEAELAAAASSSKKGFYNSSKRVLATILKHGYLPTKIADSFAIASGGATYYRNRIKMYEKQGLKTKEAEKKAWIDFQAVAERTQQSSRPDLLSQQQVSVAGRLVLPFGNTPMQMNRIGMKEVLDVSKGRYEGYFGENSLTHKMSKISYYWAIQSAIFAGLQSAAFAVWTMGDDEPLLAKKKIRAANTMADSFLRGMGIQGAVLAGMKNAVMKFAEQNKKGWNKDFSEVGEALLNISPTIGSKFSGTDAAGNTYKYNEKDIQEKGFSLDNTSGIEAVAQTIQAITNAPTYNYFKKNRNIRAALDEQNAMWQRMHNFMGYSPYDVGAADYQKKKQKKNTETKVITF